jgi:hypothetical protein
MALTIVWRNPFSLVRFSRTLKRIISNELGAQSIQSPPRISRRSSKS